MRRVGPSHDHRLSPYAMTASRTATPSLSSRVRVSSSAGVIRVRDPDLFSKPLGDFCVVFLRRLFALDEVAWVDIDRDRFSAHIGYDAGRYGLPEFLKRLTTALRCELSPTSAVPESLFAGDLICSASKLRFERYGTMITTWHIVHDRPGRIRVRHHAIRADLRLASRIQSALENVAGRTRLRSPTVHRQRTDQVRPRAGQRVASPQDTGPRAQTCHHLRTTNSPAPNRLGSRCPIARWDWP